MVPLVLCCLLSALLASSQPLAPEDTRSHYLKTTAMKQSKADLHSLIEEHPALTSETRQFLECSTTIKQTALVLEKQDPIVADLVKAVERTSGRLDGLVSKHEIDRSVYDYATDPAEMKGKIRPDSAMGTLTFETLMGWARLAKAIYYGGYERKMEVKAAMTGKEASKLFPKVQASPLQSYIAQHAPEFADYMVVDVVTRHASEQHSAAILFNKAKKHLVIAFVGTQSLADWTYNLHGLKRSSQFTKGFNKLKVHSGFHDLIQEQFDDIIKAVKKVVRTLSTDDVLRNGLRVTTTGHSLGGAMSTLMAYVLKTQVLGSMGMKDCVVQNFSFASPRVFDGHSAKKVHKALGADNIIRTYNHSDIVPFLPCEFMGFALDSVVYKHVGTPIKVVSPAYGGPLYHHGMGEYVERIAEQLPAFFQVNEAFKRDCRQLLVFNQQLASMRAMKDDFEAGQKVCWNLARDHGDRIEQDLYIESSAVKKSSGFFERVLASALRLKVTTRDGLNAKDKAQKGVSILAAYGGKIRSAKKLIKNLQSKAMRPVGRFKKTLRSVAAAI